MPSKSDTSNTSDTPPPTPGPSKKNHPPNPHQTTITVDECFTNFKKYITNERPGLSAFYDDLALHEVAKKAQDMSEKLLVKKCGKEIAMQLSLLTLYDIALLLGLNPLVFFSWLHGGEANSWRQTTVCLWVLRRVGSGS